MSPPAIQVSNISKRYKLGAINRHTFRDELLYRWHTLRGRDPGAHMGKINRPAQRADGEFWALKDVSFEVGQGEVLGVIGGNGAGKSTLLKILTRVTEPTSGRAVIAGRVGSLLEVGTGFHPELTGRENIYMNGTILGMKRREIDAKFDEIVDFSGVERFLDTPVKRYSSGMYVRLAFAVAAHLEPEVLLVDEVLAVGDAAFQKKCLGKMGEIAKGGRTILFVSHNMDAVKQLCGRCLWFQDGAIVGGGPSEAVVQAYVSAIQAVKEPVTPFPARIEAMKLTVAGFASSVEGGDLLLSTAFVADETLSKLGVNYRIKTDAGQVLHSCYDYQMNAFAPKAMGRFTIDVRFRGLLGILLGGRYWVDLIVSVVGTGPVATYPDVAVFEVPERRNAATGVALAAPGNGLLFIDAVARVSPGA